MKTIMKIWMAGMLACGGVMAAPAQGEKVDSVMVYGYVSAVNPYPLTLREHDRLIKRAKKVCQKLLEKNGGWLSHWPRDERAAYLKAKGSLVILQLAPDYYRDYAYPRIVRKGETYYLQYFFDAAREDYGLLDQLATISIRNQDGNVEGLFAGSRDIGRRFFEPKWEQEMVEDIEAGRDSVYSFIKYVYMGTKPRVMYYKGQVKEK